jgi:large subunit ribosomal protein L24
MKADTERKKYHTEKLHKRKNRLHAHLSKELKSKLKVKKRAILVRKGDTVRIMRGPGKGKEAKIGDVNTVRRKVFVEGVVAETAKGRETPAPLEPSNLLLLSLEPTKERKKLFSEDAFKKKEKKKPEAKTEEPKKAEAKAAPAKDAPVKSEVKEPKKAIPVKEAPEVKEQAHRLLRRNR